MSAQLFMAALLSFSLIGTATAQTVPRPSCYTEVPSPGIDMVTIVLIDSTSPRAESVIADYKRVAAQATARSGQRYVILTFAGLAPGQHVTRVDDFTIEAPIRDQDLQARLPIVAFRRSQKCVSTVGAALRTHIPVVVSAALPARGDFQRSEIVYALRETLREFAVPGRAVRILVYSDALQHSRVLSFYSDRRPRRIDAEVELRKVPAEWRAAPVAELGDVSVLWFGVLAQNDDPGRAAPIDDYHDPATMEQLKKFWTRLLAGWGVRRVQMGYTVLNPQLEMEGPALAARSEPPVRGTLTAARQGR